MLEHLSVIRSCNYPDTARFQNTVLKNGGKITATISRDDVAYLVKTHKTKYKDAVSFLYELFANPALKEEDFFIQKEVIRQEIYQNYEDPRKHIGRISYRILYPGQRFERFNTGSIEDVNNLKFIPVVAFRTRMYDPSNFVLSVCGDIKTEEFFTMAEQLFNRIPRKKHAPDLNYVQNKKFDFQIETRPGLLRMHVKIDYYGYKTDDPKKYLAYILAKIFSDRLNTNLLKNQTRSGIAVYSPDTGSFSSNSYGLFGSYAAINREFLEEYLTLYYKTAQDIVINGISSDECGEFKQKSYMDYVYLLEKTSLRADFYSELYLYNNITKDHSEELRNYLKCTEEDIQKTALEIFGQEPKITIIDKDLKADNFLKIHNRI